jgi:hypothetical protein
VPYAYSATYSDTAAFARLLQGKDTVALDARFVNEGQANSIFTPMIIDTVVTMAKIERMGQSAGFKFRHASEQKRYEDMKKMIKDSK